MTTKSSGTWSILNRCAAAATLFLAAAGGAAEAEEGGAAWREVSRRAVLTNDVLEARFCSGIIYQLKEREEGKLLLSVEPEALPAEIPLFGGRRIDLDDCEVSQELSPGTVTTEIRCPDRTVWELHWEILPARGDLVLRSEARTEQPVGMMQIPILGCDISGCSLVMVDGNGASQAVSAPWEGGVDGLENAHISFNPRVVQPLVALFQGEEAGWFLAGRDPLIGPSATLTFGEGSTAGVVMCRAFPHATRAPGMFEIRLRTYRGAWQDAVDPYVDWMEHDVGFVPVNRKPPGWVKNIRSQAYVNVGDFEGLEALARRLDPAKTIVGRMGSYRHHAFDHGFPDYRPTPEAAKWFRRARELGFHVGAHVNTTGVDLSNPDMVRRFRHGFMEFVKDADGSQNSSEPAAVHSGRVRVDIGDGERTYWGVPPTFAYSTAANPDWRRFLVRQLRPMVEAGVDMIYLDESMAATGKFMMDGATAIDGVMALEKAILDAYPHVVLETEQISPMNARWSSFCLTTLDLGHPLGGYIYSRFVKFLPEGYFYSPEEEKWIEPFQSFGFMLPGADKEPGWLDIAEAFQNYDLEPDSRLPRNAFQLSGFRGPGGVTAYYEKHPGKRGLVVYASGEAPKWVGARVTGVRSWPGPGGIQDWFMYDGDTVLGLNPTRTYVFDKTVRHPRDTFHITGVPDDFLVHTRSVDLYGGQDLVEDGSYYKVAFTGNGEITVFAPDDFLVFLNAEEVTVDRATGICRAQVAATEDEPGVLLAFRKLDTELAGKWIDLPWQVCPKRDPGFIQEEGDGFFNHIGRVGAIVGRFPDAASIRIQGAWQLHDRSKGRGDAVVRINGAEVFRLPPGKKPYPAHTFDVDITAFAGKHAHFEFGVDGVNAGFSPSNWSNPRIVVTR